MTGSMSSAPAACRIDRAERLWFVCLVCMIIKRCWLWCTHEPCFVRPVRSMESCLADNGLLEDAAAAADEGGDGEALMRVTLQQAEDARAEAAKPAQHLLPPLCPLLPWQRLLPHYPRHHLHAPTPLSQPPGLPHTTSMSLYQCPCMYVHACTGVHACVLPVYSCTLSPWSCPTACIEARVAPAAGPRIISLFNISQLSRRGWTRDCICQNLAQGLLCCCT